MAEAQDEAHDSGMSPGCCPVKHLVDTVILELVDLGGRRLQEASEESKGSSANQCNDGVAMYFKSMKGSLIACRTGMWRGSKPASLRDVHPFGTPTNV